MHRRRFPAPWTIERIPGGWRVDDASGANIAYVYGDDRPRGAADDGMTVDEARRIAAGIARLPELLSGARGFT